MKCEKCGNEISRFMLNIFDRDGSDYDYPHSVEECKENAVVIETTPDWCGYELSEEEQMECISCPHCGKFPFKHKEGQVYTFVRVVCFNSDKGEQNNG